MWEITLFDNERAMSGTCDHLAAAQRPLIPLPFGPCDHLAAAQRPLIPQPFGPCDHLADGCGRLTSAALHPLDEVTPSTSRISSERKMRAFSALTESKGESGRKRPPLPYDSVNTAYTQQFQAVYTLISVRLIRSSCESLNTSTKYAEKPATRTTRS